MAGYIPYIEYNSDDSRDIHPVNPDVDFVPDPKARPDTSLRNRKRLPTLADVCDAYLISDYAGATIDTAALTDSEVSVLNKDLNFATTINLVLNSQHLSHWIQPRHLSTETGV